jgi:hypothetical protein
MVDGREGDEVKKEEIKGDKEKSKQRNKERKERKTAYTKQKERDGEGIWGCGLDSSGSG